MYVHCDFLDFTPWGGTASRILKTIPIPSQREGEYHTVNFDNLDFMPIENVHFNAIDFTLLNHSGKELRFRDSDLHSETHINVIFKHFPVQ